MLGKKTHNHATRSKCTLEVSLSLSILETFTTLMRLSIKGKRVYICITVLFPYEADNLFKASL